MPKQAGEMALLLQRAKSVEVVFFDAAGTLFALRQPPGSLYLQYALKHGFEPEKGESTAAELEQSFRIVFQESPPLCFPGEPLSDLPGLERRWWYRIVRNVFKGKGSFPGFEPFFDEIYQFFGTSEPWALEGDCIQTLQFLKDHGLRLGVISNFDSRLFGLLEALGISDFFQSVTISSQAPAAKPDPRIFRAAVDEMGSEVNRCIHVGDRVVDDLHGARGAGMQAVLYGSKAQSGDVCLRIARLTELCRLLV